MQAQEAPRLAQEALLRAPAAPRWLLEAACCRGWPQEAAPGRVHLARNRMAPDLRFLLEEKLVPEPVMDLLAEAGYTTMAQLAVMEDSRTELRKVLAAEFGFDPAVDRKNRLSQVTVLDAWETAARHQDEDRRQEAEAKASRLPRVLLVRPRWVEMGLKSSPVVLLAATKQRQGMDASMKTLPWESDSREDPHWKHGCACSTRRHAGPQLADARLGCRMVERGGRRLCGHVCLGTAGEAFAEVRAHTGRLH